MDKIKRVIAGVVIGLAGAVSVGTAVLAEGPRFL